MKLEWDVITCDRCDRFGGVAGTTVGTSMLPTHWTNYTSGGWGMTNYTRTETLCDSCTREQQARDAEAA